MTRNSERHLLQAAVALACAVPLGAGAAGVVLGPGMLEDIWPAGNANLESHFRYLSGLLLGVGLAFLSSIPSIERRSVLFAALSGIVVIGGIARLAAMPGNGSPSSPHLLALGMELLVVPFLLAWQRRIARRFKPTSLSQTSVSGPASFPPIHGVSASVSGSTEGGH